MPNAANMPEPASAPPTRAKSEVVREMPMAATSWSLGMLSATSAMRTPRSDGRTKPLRPAMMNTSSGVNAPAKATAMRMAASAA